MPLFDFCPPENTNALTLVRTWRLFVGAEGGTEVNWQDGYSPEITICGPTLLPGSPLIHTFIVNCRIPRFWTQYTEFQLQFSLPRLPQPRRTQTGRIGVWTSVIEILILQTLLTDGGGYCNHQSIVWNLRELTRVWVILSLRLPCFGDSTSRATEILRKLIFYMHNIQTKKSKSILDLFLVFF